MKTGKNNRILIVEAEADVRDACAGAAERLGCVVYSTAYIDDFEIVMEQLEPAMVVLDLNMLSRGGADLLNHLVDSQSDARVLLLSASDQRIYESATMLAASLGLDGIRVMRRTPSQLDLIQVFQRHLRAQLNIVDDISDVFRARNTMLHTGSSAA